jgi:UDP-N-acetylmuramoyl-tripeptide--D-alanyl-D-alanine ligase
MRARPVGLGLPVYVVRDTLVALGQLGTAWRRAWGRSVIAVAGSKRQDQHERIAQGGTRRHARRARNEGQSQQPRRRAAHVAGDSGRAEVAVVELGTNSPGEIATLRAMVEPDVAVLTSIGEEHLEGLGDLAGVLREESDVFDGVTWPWCPLLILKSRA